MIRIFLAHAAEDEEAVSDLYQRLKAHGFQPWLDKVDLLPGQNWESVIPKAIKESDVFIACLSAKSVSKKGYIQREFRMALIEVANRPSKENFLIPVRLDDCQIPDLRQNEYGIRLRSYHWVNLFEPDGFDRLVKAINANNHKFPGNDSQPVVLESISAQVQDLEGNKNTPFVSQTEGITSLQFLNWIGILVVVVVLLFLIYSYFTSSSSPTIRDRSTEPITLIHLEELLQAHQWQIADKETRALMLKTAEKEEARSLDAQSIKHFPRKTLEKIDQLWISASNGKFGFSAQKKIYVRDCNGEIGDELDVDAWICFRDKAGWPDNNGRFNYSELPTDNLSPKSGQFPYWGWEPIELAQLFGQFELEYHRPLPLDTVRRVGIFVVDKFVDWCLNDLDRCNPL